MDWNWFFSSLSQSSAAIVGIFGAFIITKILSNQATYSEKTNRYRDVLTKCERVVDNANDLHINWYNKRKTEDALEMLEEKLDKNNTLTSEQLYDELNFSIYMERKKAINIIELFIENRNKKIEKENEEFRNRAAAYSKNNSGFAYAKLDPVKIPKLNSNINIYSQIQNKKESINLVVRDARHHARLAGDMLDGIRGNPESSQQITYALMLVTTLFFSGVIYPLSFLPTPPSGEFHLSFGAFIPMLFSIKGAFLAAVSVVFSAVLVMFFLLNLHLKYSEEVINYLEKYTHIGAYSEYFSIMESNMKARADISAG